MLVHSSAANYYLYLYRPCLQTRAVTSSTLCASLQHSVGPAMQLIQNAQVRCAPPSCSAAVKVAAALRPSQHLSLHQPHTLEACMELVHSNSAASLTGAKPTQQNQQAIAILQQQQRPDDYWLLIECGTWDGHPGMPEGWTGPARSIMQCWMDGKLCVDYTLWALDENGLPNGDEYYSGRELELLTSKWKNKKFIRSVLVLREGTSSGTVLKTWMAHVLGVTELVCKVRNAASPPAKKSLNAAAREGEKRAQGAAAGGSERGSGAGAAAGGTGRVRRSRHRP